MSDKPRIFLDDNADQPPGVDVHDPTKRLPDIHGAAERIEQFLSRFGDGEIWDGDSIDPKLYSRDLEALRKLPARIAKMTPRIITDPYQDNGPEDLPSLSVVLSDGKPAIMQRDRTFMDYDGCSWDFWEMAYPLTVIWEPAQ